MANIAINATAEQIEKMANMGIDESPAQDSENLVTSGGVFSAVDEVKKSIEKLKTLELLTDITLEEDTRIVSLTQTQDGKPLNLNRVFVYFIGETTALSTFYLYYNNGSAYQLYRSTGISSGKFAFWVYSEKLNSNLWISRSPEKGIVGGFTTDNGLQGTSIANKTMMSDIYFRPDTKIDITSLLFGIATYSGSNMKTGSRILIYGENND